MAAQRLVRLGEMEIAVKHKLYWCIGRDRVGMCRKGQLQHKGHVGIGLLFRNWCSA